MTQRETKDGSEPEAIGGEIRIGQGAAPPFLKWFNYLMFVVAAVYLLANPVSEGYLISVVFALVTFGWLLYIFVQKKPPEP